MAIQWKDMRDFIRLAILKDVETLDPTTGQTSVQFSNEALLVAARWAAVQLSMHTAERATISFNGNGEKYQFDLPDFLVDGIEKASLIYYIGTQNEQEVIPPMRMLPGTRWTLGIPTAAESFVRAYWEWPNDILSLTFIPEVGSRVEVRCFKTWDPPEDDDSALAFPRQFEQPFAYFVGALAFDPLSAQASSIRQWNRKSDSGTPEDNPLIKQALYFRQQAQECLNDIGPQDRETFYREGHRDFGFTR